MSNLILFIGSETPLLKYLRYLLKIFHPENKIPSEMEVVSRYKLLTLLMSHSQMLGKVESGGGPIFKVVLEC